MQKGVTVFFYSPVLLSLEGREVLLLHCAVLLLPIVFLFVSYFPELAVMPCGDKYCFIFCVLPLQQ